MQPKAERNSGFELLRILAMLLIVASHYALKGGLYFPTFSFNRVAMGVVNMFEQMGVNLFILLTGYFLCNGAFRWQKVALLNLQTLFYCWLSFALTRVLLPEAFGWKDVVELLFPVVSGRYWFITVYLVLYMASPYLNKLLHALTQREYGRLLCGMLVVWSVIPTLFGMLYDDTETLLGYSRLMWFVVVYLVGGYLRLYPQKLVNTKKRALLLAASSFAVLVASVLVIERFPGFFSRLGVQFSCYLWRPNTVPLFGFCVGLFLLFKNLHIPQSRIINRVASSALGVYMLHDGLLSPWLWSKAIHPSDYVDSPWLLPYMLAACLMIYAVSCLIDWGRQWLERRLVLPMLDRMQKKRKVDSVAR